MKTDEITERLRRWGNMYASQTLTEAADALEAQAAEIARLRKALAEIADHCPERDPVFDARLETLKADSDACPECVRARQRAWPPSGLCSTHYSPFAAIWREQEASLDARRWSEPKEIARRALATPSTTEETSR